MQRIKKLYALLDKSRKRQVYKYILITILNAFNQALWVGLVGQSLNFFNYNQTSNNSLNNFFSYLANFTGLNRNNLDPINVIFAIVIYSLLTLIFQIYTFKEGSNLGARISSFYNRKTYDSIFLNTKLGLRRNSNSKEIDALSRESDLIMGSIISPFLRVIGLSVTALLIIIFLLITTRESFLLVILITFISYFIINLIFSGRIKKTAISRENYGRKSFDLVSNSLNSIDEIRAYSKEDYFQELFSKIEFKYKRFISYQYFLSLVPRATIETIFAILIILLVGLYSLNSISQSDQFQTISTLILGISKLLPTTQGIYTFTISLRSYLVYLDRMILNLERYENTLKYNSDIQTTDLKEESSENIIKLNSIKLRNLDLKVKNENQSKGSYQFRRIIKDFNFDIKKGDRILISGPSGCGKSTLLRALVGINKVNSGEITYNVVNKENKDIILTNKLVFNSKNLRSLITKVSQNSFIVDGSLIENIALGVDPSNIDLEKINKIIDIVCLQEVVLNNSLGLHQPLINNAEKLSGGQKKRISIARGLYFMKNLLVLDESTSALDVRMEEKIINNIINFIGSELILLIVSHRKLNKKLYTNSIMYNSELKTFYIEGK